VSHLVESFLAWSQECLRNSDEAKEYLLSRGSTPDQWQNHSLGFVSEYYDPSSTLDSEHSDKCDIKEEYCDTCRFKKWSTSFNKDMNKYVVGESILNSVVYPLTGYSGKPYGFQIRNIKEKRYDTYVYDRRPEATFFGLSYAINKIWSTKTVFLVEGPSDMLTLERVVGSSVLALTTNSLNEKQTRFIKRFCKKVYLALDLDMAGRDGSKAIEKKLGPDIDLFTINYRHKDYPVKDVNELWRSMGIDKLRNHINSCISAL
jgi:DNA primase